MTTVGEYAQEKMLNMTRWLHSEGVINDNHLTQVLNDLTPVRAVFVVAQLKPHRTLLLERKWAAFVHATHIPPPVTLMISNVRSRPELHDKFWRYIELFLTLVEKQA